MENPFHRFIAHLGPPVIIHDALIIVAIGTVIEPLRTDAAIAELPDIHAHAVGIG